MSNPNCVTRRLSKNPWECVVSTDNPAYYLEKVKQMVDDGNHQFGENVEFKQTHASVTVGYGKSKKKVKVFRLWVRNRS